MSNYFELISNKKGQTLVVFIILIPIILLGCAFIIDNAIRLSSQVKLEETTKSVIKSTYANEKELNTNNIKNLLIKNDINVDNLEIINTTDGFLIKNSIKVNSIFGQIIGIKDYDVSLNLKVISQDNKIIFE